MLQLRSKNKKICPSSWDISVAGHISAGEKPLTSALREIKEEINLEIKEKDLEFYRIKKYPAIVNKNIINNEFAYIYLLKYDGTIESLKKQDEELDDLKFVSIEFLERNLGENSKEYVPHGKYWFEMIKIIKGKLQF